jgi:hypothetical protein
VAKLSEDEAKALKELEAKRDAPDEPANSRAGRVDSSLAIPWESLTPAQQARARREAFGPDEDDDDGSDSGDGDDDDGAGKRDPDTAPKRRGYFGEGS